MAEAERVPWDEAYADDVDQRLAMVIWFPHLEQYSDVREEVESLINQAAEVAFLSGVSPEISLSRYQIGPSAEALFSQYLVTVYQQVTPYLNDAASLIAIAEFTRAVVLRIKERFRQGMKHPHSDEWIPVSSFMPVISKPMVIGLAFDHFHENYRAEDQGVSIDTRHRSLYPEYTSSRHPGGMETYVVRIWTGQTSYVYVVDSKGNAVEHFSIRGRELVSLPLPVWFGSDFLGENAPEVPPKPIDVNLT